MSDPYLYEDVPVLKNKLGIKNEQTLDRIEAEQSRANMMLLYEQGFQDFSPNGLREIHRTLFGDIYEWAGQYRIINIEKREKLLAGRSVWYSNDDRIEEDLDEAFRRLGNTRWDGISREQFVHQLTQHPQHHRQDDPRGIAERRPLVKLDGFHAGSLNTCEVEHGGQRHKQSCQQHEPDKLSPAQL